MAFGDQDLLSASPMWIARSMPACRSRIAAFDQVAFILQHYCARSRFDLRNPSKVPISPAAPLIFALSRRRPDRWAEVRLFDVCYTVLALADQIREALSRIYPHQRVFGESNG